MKKDYTNEQKVWMHLQASGFINNELAVDLYGIYRLSEYIRRIRKKLAGTDRMIGNEIVEGRKIENYVLKNIPST